MQIECPKCFKDNNVDFEKAIVCGHCKEGFSGHKFKKPGISAAVALAVGIGGTSAAGQFFEVDRYPLPVEYELVDVCTNSDRTFLKKNVYQGKKDICFCTVKSATESYSYSDFKDNQAGINKYFKSALKECGG